MNLVSSKMSDVWITQDKDQAVIQIDKVLAMPKPLQRRAIQLILNYLYLERPSSLSALHIDQLFSFVFESSTICRIASSGGPYCGKIISNLHV